MLAENVKSTASSTVTITVAVSITSRVEARRPLRAGNDSTLAGTLHFSTRDGDQFTLRPGDVLLAEDTAGSGHQWRLEGTDPWRRMYVVLADGADVPFVPY